MSTEIRKYEMTTGQKVALGVTPLAVTLAPALAFAEGETAATDTVQTAIVGMATSVATAAGNLIGAILPVLAPVVAAIIIATLGYRLIKKFSK